MGLSDKKLCCNVSGKRDVSRVTLQEFNISYILLKDSHAYCITMA